jgi:hypothetical protein
MRTPLALGTALVLISMAGDTTSIPPVAAGAQPLTSNPRPDEIVTILLPATVPWTDTGVSVRAGDALDIRTWGRVTFDAAATTAPEGSDRQGGGCSFVVTDPTVAAHSVPEGRLMLGFNDDGMLCDRSGYDSWDFAADNSGWFTAEIAIRRRKPQTGSRE